MKIATVKELIRNDVDRDYIRACMDDDLSDDAQWLEKAYYASGSHRDCIEHLMDLFDDLYLADVPSVVRSYIDYDKWANDLLIDDYSIIEHDGCSYLICNH